MQWENGPEWLRGFDAALTDVRELGSEAGGRHAEAIKDAARAHCPVGDNEHLPVGENPGDLQESIEVTAGVQLEDGEQGIAWEVGTDKDYASYVEFGTSRAQAHPFMRPAVHETSDGFGESVRVV